MLVEAAYDRKKAVAYAEKWATRRNPKYYNFDKLGGDCTNFISQCVYAGCGIMNYKLTYGWYYISPGSRSPSWSGVAFLYNFLVGNKAAGPYARKTDISAIRPGDVIQLGETNGRFYHSLFVCRVGNPPSLDNILICTHTDDAYLRPLFTYEIRSIRFLHIEGARKWKS